MRLKQYLNERKFKMERECSSCRGHLGYIDSDKDPKGGKSHGVCNACLPKVYPEIYKKKANLKDNDVKRRK